MINYCPNEINEIEEIVNNKYLLKTGYSISDLSILTKNYFLPFHTGSISQISRLSNTSIALLSLITKIFNAILSLCLVTKAFTLQLVDCPSIKQFLGEIFP